MSNTNSDGIPCGALFALILVGFFIGFMIGGGVVRYWERSRAVEAGVGHYQTDPKTGWSIEFIYDKKEP